MSMSTLIFILLVILVVGITTIKSLFKKTVVTATESLNNGLEVIYYASKSARDASVAYLAENSMEANKKLQKLRNSNPEWFDLDSKL